MEIWKITAAGDSRYTFTLSGAVLSVGQVRIEDAGRTQEVHGPIGTGTSFDVELTAGDYAVSWHWMEGNSDVRAAAWFHVPFDGPERLVRYSAFSEEIEKWWTRRSAEQRVLIEAAAQSDTMSPEVIRLLIDTRCPVGPVGSAWEGQQGLSWSWAPDVRSIILDH